MQGGKDGLQGYIVSAQYRVSHEGQARAEGARDPESMGEGKALP